MCASDGKETPGISNEGVVHAPYLIFQRFFYAGAAAEAHNKLTKIDLFVKAGPIGIVANPVLVFDPFESRSF